MLADLILKNSEAFHGHLLSGEAAHVPHRAINSYRVENPSTSVPHEAHWHLKFHRRSPNSLEKVFPIVGQY